MRYLIVLSVVLTTISTSVDLSAWKGVTPGDQRFIKVLKNMDNKKEKVHLFFKDFLFHFLFHFASFQIDLFNFFCFVFRNITSKHQLVQSSNLNATERCGICSKLRKKITGQRHWRRCGVLIVNFGHILYLFPAFYIVNFEHEFSCWVSWDFKLVKSSSDSFSRCFLVKRRLSRWTFFIYEIFRSSSILTLKWILASIILEK